MSTPTLHRQTARVFGYLRGMHATHFLDVGTRLGLFEALAEGPRTPAELASDLGLHEPYLRAFCEMGFHLEVMERNGDGFSLAPEMDRLLARPDDPFYLAGFPRVHLSLSRDYARYPELFRSGGVYPYQAHDREFLEGVAGATRMLPALLLETLAPRMPGLVMKLMAGGRVLDVGCGAGHALLAFARRFPRCQGVGLEIEPVSAAMAREQIAAASLQERLQVVEGWDQLPPGTAEGGFDLVTQFLVTHEIQPALKREVVGRCAAALRPGGLLVLFDECLPADDTAARDPILGFSVVAQWFELVWGNVINTRGEILDLIEGAGLQPADDVELSRFRIFTARKPEE
jgi:SAM-dependent methyltransferase